MSKITIIDSKNIPHPESRAVLQAMVSRSTTPIEVLRERVNEDKTDSFISINCIGYGHDSILENADGIIINLHGISMLAAKAIEDTSRFKGTEASTRYIDITALPVHVDSIDEEHPDFIRRWDILQKQLTFFKDMYPAVQLHMRQRFPYEFLSGQNDQNFNEGIYYRAINAKTFDVMRAFLPPGASTIVNWSTDLRTLKDRLTELAAHPLVEVQQLAGNIARIAAERYSASFKNFPNAAIIDHIEQFGYEYHYFNEDPVYGPLDIWNDPAGSYQKLNIAYSEEEIEYIKNTYPSLQKRPRGAPLPRLYASKLNVSGLMDFGSFRDIQRQRNGLCKISMLHERFGFEKWYLEQLPEAVKNLASDHLYNLEQEINKDSLIDPLDKQYYVPFGYRLPYVLDYSIEQCVYVTELRASRHVHPTCRFVAQSMTRFFDEKFPFINIFPDRSEGDFDIRRGTHDIDFSQKTAA